HAIHISNSTSSYSPYRQPPPPSATLFPYTTLFRSLRQGDRDEVKMCGELGEGPAGGCGGVEEARAVEIARHAELTGGARLFNAADRKSTRLNSSHVAISYAVFCLKKKKQASCLTVY